MKFNLIVLISLCYSAYLSTLNAADDMECALAMDALVGEFDKKSERVASYKSNGIDNRHYSELVTLKNGLSIEYSVGGCAHYAFSYTFRNSGFSASGDWKKDFAFIISLLQQAPEKNGDPPLSSVLIDLMNKEINSDKFDKSAGKDHYNINCGDAFCSVDYSDPNNIIVDYDFAL